ncbi:MAG: acetylglutamate kinase [Dehalococcoidia bacterium]|jgi:acetylglutamate kinase|nr:acetylglutamate kinase [Dehalococcoidia bacterium]
MPIVVKIGGSTLGEGDTTLEDLAALQRREESPVVVHGGGKEINRWLDRLGVQSSFVDGLRVTDEAVLEVVLAVLAGTVNKGLVAQLIARGGRAVGLSGIDTCLLEAEVRRPELGQVGEITRVDDGMLWLALRQGYIPVIAPIGVDCVRGTPLNINADTAAGEIARAMKAQRLIFLTDVPGIVDRGGEVIPELTAAEARRLVESGVASGGMLPKIEACLRSGATCRIIDGRRPHALLREVDGDMAGTTVAGENG